MSVPRSTRLLEPLLTGWSVNLQKSKYMATFIKPSDVPEATSRSEFKHLLGYDANDEWIKGSMNVITPMANGSVAGIVKDGEHVTFVNGVPVVTKASDTTLGLAKSGEDIKFNNGVPSIAKAGNGTPGLTQDGEHVTYDANGKPVVKKAGDNQLGLAKSGDKIKFNDGVPNIVNASIDDTGVVKVGDNIDVAEDGTISVKKASKTDFGVVKVGDNLNVKDGVLSVPRATDKVTGVVRGSSLSDALNGYNGISIYVTQGEQAESIANRIKAAGNIVQDGLDGRIHTAPVRLSSYTSTSDEYIDDPVALGWILRALEILATQWSGVIYGVVPAPSYIEVRGPNEGSLIDGGTLKVGAYKHTFGDNGYTIERLHYNGDWDNVEWVRINNPELASGETPGVVKSSPDITFTDGVGTINRDLTMNVLRVQAPAGAVFPQNTTSVLNGSGFSIPLPSPITKATLETLDFIEVTDIIGVRVLLHKDKSYYHLEGSSNISVEFHGYCQLTPTDFSEYSGGNSVLVTSKLRVTNTESEITSITLKFYVVDISDHSRRMQFLPSNAMDDLIAGTISEVTLTLQGENQLDYNTWVIRAAWSINDPCYYFYKCGDDDILVSNRYICHVFRDGKWHILNASPDPNDRNFTKLIVTYSGAIGSADVPVATATTPGIVKPGTGLTVTEDGTLNASGGDLPIASKTVLGGIKVGNRVTIKDDGTLDVPRADSGHVSGDYAMGVINPSQPLDDIGISSVTDDDGRINNIVAVRGKARTRVIPLNSGSNLDALMQLYAGLDVVFKLDGNYIGGPKASSLGNDGTLYNYKGIMKCEGNHFVFFDENTQEMYHAYQGFGTSAKNMWWTKLPTTPYSLPIASARTLGGVKVGSGLTIDSGGLLSTLSPIIYDTVTQGELYIVNIMNSITHGVTHVIYIGKNPELGFFPPMEEINALMIPDGPGASKEINAPYFRGELIVNMYTAKLNGFLYRNGAAMNVAAPIMMTMLNKNAPNRGVLWWGAIDNSVSKIYEVIPSSQPIWRGVN